MPSRLRPSAARCLALALILAASLTCAAQTPTCRAADLDLTFRFANDPPTTYTLAILSRNISQHACTLIGHYLPNFVLSDTTQAPVKLCEDCDRRQPNGQILPNAPLLLQPDEIAHQTYRWKTTASPGDPPCRQARWMTTQASNDQEHAIFFVAPSLLPAICSQVDVEGYARGTTLDEDDSVPTDSHTEPALRLSSAKTTFYPGEFFTLQAEVGSASTSPSTFPSLIRLNAPCPTFYLRQRSADGYTRIDQFHSPQIRCQREGSPSLPQPHITTAFDSFAHLQDLDLGDNTVQFLALVGSQHAARINLAESNRLVLHIADATILSRKWGPTEQGVRVDLTLDKLTYALGEDIPLHIATQNVSAMQPVYGEPFVRRGEYLSTAAGAFHLTIIASDGIGAGSDKPDNLYRAVGGSSGQMKCPEPLPPGRIVPFERSAQLYDLLPNIPGTYQLVVTWSPYMSQHTTCDATKGEPTAQPFVTVSSAPITIHVTGGPATSEEVSSLPQFTSWQSNFTLVDTPFGKKSALLDRDTHLEWLRLSATANKSQETLSRAMAPHRPMDGWRFATLDEVIAFFTHFTGVPGGRSKDPSVERELQDLMGGPLSSPKSTGGGWARKVTNGHVAGFITPPNGPVGAPRFQFHFAYIGEELRDGQVTAAVDPNRIGYIDGDRSGPEFGVFVVREH